jgi:hypothetical protein
VAVVAATKMAMMIRRRPTRPIPNNRTRARRPAPQPGGLASSAAPPQVRPPGTPWGVVITTPAGPAQGKPAHQTGSETATRNPALRARRLGEEVEGRRHLHRLAAGRDMNLRALAGVVGDRCEREVDNGKGMG